MQLPAHLSAEELPRYVIVEGPIGVGKTTLVQRLSSILKARTVLEVFEENPFLKDFYQDNDRYAFQTEMFFLLSRYQQQERFAQEDLFTRFSVSDYLFQKCRIFASMTLKEHEYQLFTKVYDVLGANIPKPDLVIYLHAPLNTLIERIERRGRSFEKTIDPNYLSSLQARYTDLFSGYNDTPLLTVDTTHINLATDDSAILHLLDEMTRTREGRRALS